MEKMGVRCDELVKLAISRCWEKIYGLSLDVGIRDSRDNTRVWEMLGIFFWMEIDNVDHAKAQGLGLVFEMDIQKRISLTRNGYLFSKDNALEQVFILRILYAVIGENYNGWEMFQLQRLGKGGGNNYNGWYTNGWS